MPGMTFGKSFIGATLLISLPTVGYAESCSSPFGASIREYGGATLKSNAWFTAKDYPISALANGYEGRVVVSFEITADGRAKNCHVSDSSGKSSLDRPICPALERKARFSPKIEADVPVATTGRMSFDFWIPKTGAC
ncbi:MAG: energy transducer TonB [Proteobacteria bacterium]|nr:energy transducer TonB [Pseudomonadota bacterium]